MEDNSYDNTVDIYHIHNDNEVEGDNDDGSANNNNETAQEGGDVQDDNEDYSVHVFFWSDSFMRSYILHPMPWYYAE